LAPLDFEIFSKKVVFSVLNGKKQISSRLVPPGKILVKFHCGPPGKNPSDAHDNKEHNSQRKQGNESIALLEKTDATKKGI